MVTCDVTPYERQVAREILALSFRAAGRYEEACRVLAGTSLYVTAQTCDNMIAHLCRPPTTQDYRR
jgi:hypothetical protein